MLDLKNIVKYLRPASYKYNDKKPNLKTGKTVLGFSAQDLAKLFPMDEYSIVNQDNDGFLYVDYVQLIAPMVATINDLTTRVEELENIIKESKESKEQK